jgi:hypothetical protein
MQRARRLKPAKQRWQTTGSFSFLLLFDINGNFSHWQLAASILPDLRRFLFLLNFPISQ